MDFHKQETDEFEYDDDVFYDQLRRQVWQLIAEEDDDDDNGEGIMRGNKILSVAAEARKRGGFGNGPCNVPQSRWYYNWPGNKEDFAPPAWILNLWRAGNGTGVFIPQTVQSRRISRSRRKNERGRTYKRVEKTT